jgi:hypothetical protein
VFGTCPTDADQRSRGTAQANDGAGGRANYCTCSTYGGKAGTDYCCRRCTYDGCLDKTGCTRHLDQRTDRR